MWHTSCIINAVMSVSPTSISFTRLAVEQARTQRPAKDTTLWGQDGFNFADIVDSVNPLQHIPGVATLYRQYTDDNPSAASKIVGSTLFGGIAGFALDAGDSVINAVSGKSSEEHLLATLGLTDEPVQQDPEAAMALFNRISPKKAETKARLEEIAAANVPEPPKVTGDPNIARKMEDAMAKYALMLQERNGVRR